MGGTLFIRILPTTSTTPQLQSFQTEGMDTMTGNDIFNSLIYSANYPLKPISPQSK